MFSAGDSYLQTRLSMLSARLVYPQSWSAIIASDLESLQKRFRCFVDISHPQAVENQLIDHALADFQLLYRPFSATRRSLLNHAIHWYELANLKALIRGKFSAEKNELIRRELIDLGQFAILPLETLLQADEPNEMLRLLEETPYSSIVRQARSIYQKEGQNLFALDAAIDRQYFAVMMQRIRFLPEHDQSELLKVHGVLMDRLNLLWLVRYRFSYGLSAAKSYYLLSTTGRRLHADQLMMLARLNSLQEVIDHLPEPLSGLLHDAGSLTAVENLLEHYTMSAAFSGLKSSSSIITRVFSYILLRESEIRWLQAVIKGKLLGLDDKLIRKAIGEP
jgi:V/A-type H+-transporting ATPase subunit C